MPLTAKSPLFLHLVQNVLLVALAIFFIPLSTFITISSWISAPYTKIGQQIDQQRQWRGKSATSARRTILVTGVGMSKGLFIARAFYQAGYTVIGADFEPFYIPVCGRFSTSLNKFYRLLKPSSVSGSGPYIKSLINVIEEQNVDLWISCSGVASAVEDGEAAEAVEKLTNCRVVQFGVGMTSLLHEKHSFIENTERIGLNVPETQLITSLEDGMRVLHSKSGKQDKTFIMKSVGMEDSIRADMTLLPFSREEQTRAHLSNLRASPSRPFVAQQFISGAEYCTHAIVIHGRVLAFTCCPSAELLMHYKALPASSEIFDALLKYTQTYVDKMDSQMTGHFSIDFLVEGESGGKELEKRIFPIECNPRAHTAVVLFAEQSAQMAEAYLTIFDGLDPPKGKTLVLTNSKIGYYWIGHDLVTRIILPLASFLSSKIDFVELKRNCVEFIQHLIYWRDGTFEIWDPWPFWALYCIYWPCIFVSCIFTGRKWSRCNVSTTKVFDC